MRCSCATGQLSSERMFFHGFRSALPRLLSFVSIHKWLNQSNLSITLLTEWDRLLDILFSFTWSVTLSPASFFIVIMPHLIIHFFRYKTTTSGVNRVYSRSRSSNKRFILTSISGSRHFDLQTLTLSFPLFISVHLKRTNTGSWGATRCEKVSERERAESFVFRQCPFN